MPWMAKPGPIRVMCSGAPVLGYIPSESVGFQSLGPRSGDTKMHAPKNRNSPGTLLEPCWNRAGTFLSSNWNLPGPFEEPSWNLVGTVLEPS